MQGMGRRYVEDARDADWHIRSAIVVPDATSLRRYRYAWTPAGYLPLDQGLTPHCVSYAGDGLLAAGPVANKHRPDRAVAYREAQKRDEWPGENYSGTSARGLMHYYREIGLIESWLNAWDVETLRLWHLVTGRPALLGCNWYSSFADVDSSGFLRISPVARVVGGHETLLLGWDDVRGAARGMNSWGKWGEKGTGRFWVDGETLERLLNEYGDIVTPIERKATLPIMQDQRMPVTPLVDPRDER